MRNKSTYVLWAVQGLLALVFLAAGAAKLAMPAEALLAQMPVPLPIALIRLIGVVELAGAAGLVLPALLRVRPGLTPLAAACLVVHMAGATGFTLAGPDPAQAAMPAVLALLAAAVAYGRSRPAARADRALGRRVAVQAAV